jgi:putative oxidoreductase
MLVNDGIGWITSGPLGVGAVPAMINVVAGALMLIGLYTPVGCLLAVVSQCWAFIISGFISQTGLLLLSVSVAVAMLGPGAWSIDAHLFGRRRLKIE